jgi:hypothetical protein
MLVFVPIGYLWFSLLGLIIFKYTGKIIYEFKESDDIEEWLFFYVNMGLVGGVSCEIVKVILSYFN